MVVLNDTWLNQVKPWPYKILSRKYLIHSNRKPCPLKIFPSMVLISILKSTYFKCSRKRKYETVNKMNHRTIKQSVNEGSHQLFRHNFLMSYDWDLFGLVPLSFEYCARSCKNNFIIPQSIYYCYFWIKIKYVLFFFQYWIVNVFLNRKNKGKEMILAT